MVLPAQSPSYDPSQLHELHIARPVCDVKACLPSGGKPSTQQKMKQAKGRGGHRTASWPCLTPDSTILIRLSLQPPCPQLFYCSLKFRETGVQSSLGSWGCQKSWESHVAGDTQQPFQMAGATRPCLTATHMESISLPGRLETEPPSESFTAESRWFFRRQFCII